MADTMGRGLSLITRWGRPNIRLMHRGGLTDDGATKLARTMMRMAIRDEANKDTRPWRRRVADFVRGRATPNRAVKAFRSGSFVVEVLYRPVGDDPEDGQHRVRLVSRVGDTATARTLAIVNPRAQQVEAMFQEWQPGVYGYESTFMYRPWSYAHDLTSSGYEALADSLQSGDLHIEEVDLLAPVQSTALH